MSNVHLTPMTAFWRAINDGRRLNGLPPATSKNVAELWQMAMQLTPDEEAIYAQAKPRN